MAENINYSARDSDVNSSMNSSSPVDTRKKEIARSTARSLSDVLPGYKFSKTVPQLSPSNSYRVPLYVTRELRSPSLFLDKKAVGEAVNCAAYFTESIRYYMGTEIVQKLKLDAKSAWDLKRQMLEENLLDSRKPAGIVSASLNNSLQFNGKKFEVAVPVRIDGEEQLMWGEAAKETGFYHAQFSNFLAATSKMPPYPPGLITLYYHKTTKDKAIEAAQDNGADSKNSHVVVNLGVDRRALLFGGVETGKEQKSVAEILKLNFPGMQSKYLWMATKNRETNESRVYISRDGKDPVALEFRDGDFYENGSTTPVKISPFDKLTWEDEMVADRFHGTNRVFGLCEKMMTGEYELVDAIAWNADALPEEKRAFVDTSPFDVKEIFHLQPKETIEEYLLSHGVTPQDLPLHMYAYEKVGIDPKRLRTFDPIPIFEASDIQAAIRSAGGLGSALAQLRAEKAKTYMEKHPGENLFVVSPDLLPAKLMAKIFGLEMLSPLGKLTGPEKQFISDAVIATNPHVLIEMDRQGVIKSAPRYNAGEVVHISDSFLVELKNRIEEQRQRDQVHIPETLPGGKRLKAARFTVEERRIIEEASSNPDVRRAMALVLVMEQKQEDDGIFTRANEKAVNSAVYNWKRMPQFVRDAGAAIGDKLESLGQRVGLPGVGSTLGKIRPIQSLGLFQIRPTQKETGWWVSQRTDQGGFFPDEVANNYREILLNDPVENAKLAAHRIEGILPHAERMYVAHKEVFDTKNPLCMALVLNMYSASEGNVLKNVLSVWASLLEDYIGKNADAGTKLEDRFEVIATKMRAQGVPLDETEVKNGLALLNKNKVAFLSSDFAREIGKWYQSQSGETLSLNIPTKVLDREDISTKHLNYGLRATSYGTVNAIQQFSALSREKRDRNAV